MRFEWDAKKNEILEGTRGISFDTIADHIEGGDLWRIADHPNHVQYPSQQIFYVLVDGYIYSVPFEIRNGAIWLVTIFPSRKVTREYRKQKNHEAD